MTWSDKIIAYNKELHFSGKLPKGVSIMNPYAERAEAWKASEAFYRKYYDDDSPRRLILGINPGRHGAGATGIPFTDPKRLAEVDIPWYGPVSHEPSSVYVYDMIGAFGGPAAFYKRYFINSVSPLGYTIRNKSGKEVNFNYYDTPALFQKTLPFIHGNLEKLRSMGFDMETVFVLGVKNARCLERINATGKYFGELVVLEHPRYVMQYRLRAKEDYIQKYLTALSDIA
ncbi:MAG TPA: uracil-DNA glycosylase family protein [Chitinophagaceae bacterium]|nr:uracil-DNA glycosylase family protein [Chitinophagaceae bacterium]